MIGAIIFGWFVTFAWTAIGMTCCTSIAARLGMFCCGAVAVLGFALGAPGTVEIIRTLWTPGASHSRMDLMVPELTGALMVVMALLTSLILITLDYHGASAGGKLGGKEGEGDI